MKHFNYRANRLKPLLFTAVTMVLILFIASACNNTPSRNNPLDVLNSTVNVGMISAVNQKDSQLPGATSARNTVISQ